MDINEAIDRINETKDFTAAESRGRIQITKFGRPAGYITEDDISSLGHTPTGWPRSKGLNKGALEVWRALSQ